MRLTRIFLNIFVFTSAVSHNSNLNAISSNFIPGTFKLDQDGICTKPGFQCLNCATPVMCIGGLKMFMHECPHEYTCNAHLGNCTKDAHAPECSKDLETYSHDCLEAGTFPHPIDCHRFYLCVQNKNRLIKYEFQCPRNYGFNLQTAQCSVKLENNQCNERLVPLCTSFLQHGPLKHSSNYYYVCLLASRFRMELTPKIFICPNGRFYWGDFCHPEPEKSVENATVTEMPTTKYLDITEMNSTTETVNKHHPFFDED